MGVYMRRLCTICARGGSKGVKGKNIREICGLPMIAHTIIQAKAAGIFQIVAVSSDSDDILNIAMKYGADCLIKRPDELASDLAAKVPVIRHCVKSVESQHHIAFDICVDLDCTSPLRDVDDIINAVRLLETTNCDNVITGMPSRRSPYFNLVEEIDGYVCLSKKINSKIVRRQDVPKTYDMNASIYAWKRDRLEENDTLFLPATKIFVMPEERSIDVDSELDFELVEYLMRKKSELK